MSPAESGVGQGKALGVPFDPLAHRIFGLHVAACEARLLIRIEWRVAISIGLHQKFVKHAILCQLDGYPIDGFSNHFPSLIMK
jgi:hypothetical protein